MQATALHKAQELSKMTGSQFKSHREQLGLDIVLTANLMGVARNTIRGVEAHKGKNIKACYALAMLTMVRADQGDI